MEKCTKQDEYMEQFMEAKSGGKVGLFKNVNNSAYGIGNTAGQ